MAYSGLVSFLACALFFARSAAAKRFLALFASSPSETSLFSTWLTIVCRMSSFVILTLLLNDFN